MTEEQAKEYLKKRGCPETVWQGGNQRLLKRWEDFVVKVENGYCPNCLIDEYWNELDTRELIHEVGCDDRVKELDERFQTMLTATHLKHHYKERNTNYDFWNYGYPKNASGFFYEQVKCHILDQC